MLPDGGRKYRQVGGLHSHSKGIGKVKEMESPHSGKSG